MFNMEMDKGLQRMQDVGIRELKIYWMEDMDKKEGDMTKR